MTVITRFAPSPTGLLHLGNAWSFLICWLAARSAGGKVLLRIDDIDPQRSSPEYIQKIIEDLEWLGLDWDDYSSSEPIVYQSLRSAAYDHALSLLQDKKLVYPCFCTRKELRALASAPHIGDEGVPYPGLCAHLNSAEQKRRIAQGSAFALRLKVPEERVNFYDLVQGERTYSKHALGGDFPLKRSDGVWSYQLASAVDDGLMDVNLVVRGRDILPSTPRQIILLSALGLPVPRYAHIPLLLDEAGNRLAKRHSSLTLSQLRENGICAERITGYLSYLAGINPAGSALSPCALVQNFDWEALPKSDIAINIESLMRSMY